MYDVIFGGNCYLCNNIDDQNFTIISLKTDKHYFVSCKKCLNKIHKYFEQHPIIRLNMVMEEGFTFVYDNEFKCRVFKKTENTPKFITINYEELLNISYDFNSVYHNEKGKHYKFKYVFIINDGNLKYKLNSNELINYQADQHLIWEPKEEFFKMKKKQLSFIQNELDNLSKLKNIN